MILPGSVFLFDSGHERIPDSLYRLHPSGRMIILDPSLRGTDLSMQYRVLSFDITRPYFHKDTVNIRERQQDRADLFRITPADLSSDTYYTYSELNKRGSLSRGITFGNNQDVVVNSNLNLQLTGRLSENLNLVAAISDNNIPIQPEGYSQQISEFDKVYIELFNEQMDLVAGDFDLDGSPGVFTDFSKRAKGAMFRGNFSVGSSQGNNFNTTVSGAVSKGKFIRNAFPGIEGNQGPYKLHGSNREQFIVVLAGSERVYIDGRLLRRGLNNDYVIDYNNAEITFTPTRPITKDKRIIVEFEYSERSYARFLVYTSERILTNRGELWVNVFSEQDDKNQTLQQDLSDEEKSILSQAGNDLQSAVVPGIDSVGFNTQWVLYRRADSLVGGILFEDVYVHSTNPDSAFFRLRFSYVGEGNGDYRPVNSVANGKVFRWYAPVNGVRQGSYEPVTPLIAPEKKQVFSLGGVQMPSDFTRTAFELAVTNNDRNTYSERDNNKNLGYAVQFGLDQDLIRRDTDRIRLLGSVQYRLTSRHFSSVERFRSVEFARDWNLEQETDGNQEHLATAGIHFFEKETGDLNMQSEFLGRGNTFRGSRNNLNGNFRYGNFELNIYGSLMNSGDTLQENRFIRHRLSLSRHFPLMILGIREEGENNLRHERNSDSLMLNSFSFQEFELFLTQPDSIQNNGFVSYKNRKDYLPAGDALRYATRGQDLNLGLNLLRNPDNSLRILFALRELSFIDTNLIVQKPERSVLARLDHGIRLANGVVTTSTFYEAGSGLEARKLYSYLEVPPGQGVYKWIDYNENTVKELDEFEIARFPDEAQYIRISLPSSDYLTVYTNHFNQAIRLNPAASWKNTGGLRQFAALFSEQFAFRINRKTASGNRLENLNPFQADPDDPDLITLSSSIRNNLSFNETGALFSVDYIYQKNQNRSLLANGSDIRITESHGLRGRVSPGNGITITDRFDDGTKTYHSEFLGSRNYDIGFLTQEITLHYQVNMAFRLVVDYSYSRQLNRMDFQRSAEHNLGTELSYSILKKGIITARMNYIKLGYNDDPGTPVAYEMLGGFLPGHNGTWSVLFQRSITGSNIELSIEYSGRVSQDHAVVHTGNLQVRANF